MYFKTESYCSTVRQSSFQRSFGRKENREYLLRGAVIFPTEQPASDATSCYLGKNNSNNDNIEFKGNPKVHPPLDEKKLMLEELFSNG
jgi:hypothetical protein